MWARKLYDWFTLEDYERAKRKAAARIAARYVRGNVAVQNGFQTGEILDGEAFHALVARGDEIVRGLRSRIPANKLQG